MLSAVALSLYQLWTPIAGIGDELARLDLRFLREHYGRLLLPDLGVETLIDALRGAVVPLALAVLATTAACARCVHGVVRVDDVPYSQRFLPGRAGAGAACAARSSA